VPADDGGDCLAAAFERHVIYFCWVDACGFGDQTDQYVIRAARGAAAPRDAAGISFKGFDQIAHSFVR
jgi:hypothetical protein